MSSVLPALFVLLGSLLAGGNDLLDAIPTKAYWDRRGVAMTVDDLARQLDPPAGDLAADLKAIGSDDADTARRAALLVVERGPAALPALRTAAAGDDPTVAAAAKDLVVAIERRPKANEVRRLMAIRALGELKDAKALPALEAAGKLGELFAAEYAAAAVARVTNRPATRPAAANLPQDAWLLPANCRAVARFRPAPAAWPTDAVLAAAVPEADRRAALADAVLPMIETLADGLGNVRLHAVTVGLAGELAEGGPGETRPAAAGQAASPAQVVVFVRATYDAANAQRWLRTTGQPVRPFDGITGTEIGPEVVLLLPSDDLFVLTAARDRAFPTAAIAKARADGKGGLAASTGPVAAWLRAAHLDRPMWGIGYFTAGDRRAGVPDGIDWLSLQGRAADDGSLDVRLSATGAKPESVQRLAADVRRAVEALRGEPAGGSADVIGTLARRLAASAVVADTEKGAELRGRLSAADFIAAAAAAVTAEPK